MVQVSRAFTATLNTAKLMARPINKALESETAQRHDQASAAKEGANLVKQFARGDIGASEFAARSAVLLAIPKGASALSKSPTLQFCLNSGISGKLNTEIGRTFSKSDDKNYSSQNVRLLKNDYPISDRIQSGSHLMQSYEKLNSKHIGTVLNQVALQEQQAKLQQMQEYREQV